ncbi:MAG: FecR domain-containing protein [Phycisphaerales bacterium]|nr:FecR domain-containing protein [Phycisphaerales bacterium]
MKAAERDWLCDGVGEPDGDERRITDALAGTRWRGDEAALLRALEEDAPIGHTHAPWTRRAAIAIAASATLAAAAWLVPGRGPATPWTLDARGALRRGQWITTGADGSAELSSPIGRVTVGPDSRLRLVRADKREQRLELAEGSIEAFIFAPPRLFLVDTPTATAVDMGCAYKPEVAPDGSGLLRVTGGWVELQASPVATRVPAGAVCRFGPGGQLGLPRFEDAPPEFGAALDRFEAGDPDALDTLLARARPRDSLTLWHLLGRTEGEARRRVGATLANLAPTDADVVSGAVALEPLALESWWERLHLSW